MAEVPEGYLMQRAAFGLAVECSRLLSEVVGGVTGSRVVVLVGSGNNGGDALYAGAHLQRRGAQVTACTLADRWHEGGASALINAGGRVLAGTDALGVVLDDADVIVDGILGIGSSGPLREPLVAAVRIANASEALRVAVDLPSGIDVNDGSIPGECFQADATVTFGCAKPGLFAYPGCTAAGAVRVVDIGLDKALPAATWQVVAPEDVVQACAPPDGDAHKYRRGVVGVVAGSPAYPGAAALAVGGARYSGVGMTAILDRGDQIARGIVDRYPDVVITTRDPRMSNRITAWVGGPGFVGDENDENLLVALAATAQPLVLDAGALSVIARSAELRRALRNRAEAGAVTVITPHAGELKTLLDDKVSSPADLARDLGAVVVAKGPATSIIAPDGTGFIDPMGTSDLACAGSGDVLSGLIGGLLAALRPPRDEAARIVAIAVWLHGAAGRLAAHRDHPVLAPDLVAAIPLVVSDVRRGEWSW